VLSKALGSRTVLSGSVSKGKNDPSQSLQMIERPLMTPDELKSIPKGSFVVMKTGTHPVRTRLRLYLEWGINFEEPYTVPERAQRKVVYANRFELEQSILRRYPLPSVPAGPAAAKQPEQGDQEEQEQEQTPESEKRTSKHHPPMKV
jgi:type IV secretion system protein VirD4